MSKYSANEKDALWQHPHVRGEGVRVVEYNGEPWETPPRAWGSLTDKDSRDLGDGNTPT